MRILFLTNFYPPYERGGYEQWCQEVAEALRDRGHEVIILTSDYGWVKQKDIGPTWIRREMHLEMELVSLRNALQFFITRKSREKENLDSLRQLIESFAPDVMLVWGMWNLPKSIPALAEFLMPGRVAYYIGDYWPTLPNQYTMYWKTPPRNWATMIPKYMLKPLAQTILSDENQPVLNFERVIFPSNFMRDELRSRNFSPQSTKIIYGAIDTSLYRYHNGSSSSQKDGDLSLLYIGRLTSDKGVHTAVEALSCLVHQLGFNHLKLTVVGAGEPDYEKYLHQLVRQEKVDSQVVFMGARPKGDLPSLYQQADIFLFTSIWPEPFGRVIVEAMACGVAVIGTATGGAAEILAPGKNALTFHANDSSDLAKQIKRLVEFPSLRQQLVEAGYRTAFEKFDICRMSGEIETYLQTLVTEE